ncbi:MAG: hypothetical protein ACO22D_06760 [Schleiferiaceae bacterium]
MKGVHRTEWDWDAVEAAAHEGRKTDLVPMPNVKQVLQQTREAADY